MSPLREGPIDTPGLLRDYGRRIRSLETHRHESPEELLKRQSDGGGREYATFVIAAANSHEEGKARANVVCEASSDQNPISQALRECYENRRFGSVELLEGDFRVDGPITDPDTSSSTFTWGRRLSMLRGQGRNTVIHAYASTSYIIDLKNCDVRDLVVESTIAGVGGIRVDGAQEVVGTLVALNASGGANVKGISVENSGTGALTNVVRNGVIVYSGTDADSVGIYYNGDNESGLVAHNVCRGIGYGILIEDNRSVVCMGNRMHGSDGTGIKFLNADEGICIGNVLRDLGHSDAIFLDNCDNMTCGPNVITGFGGDAGIRLVSCSQTNVEGNVIRGSMTDTILIEATCSDCRVTNNDILSAISDSGTATITAAGNRT